VQAWGTDSSLRVRDIREYLEWQLQAITEGLDWYFHCNWLTKVMSEEGKARLPLVEMEIIDRMEREVREHSGRMLCNGRFDDGDDDVEEVSPVKVKRRRVG
jgi:hypothetical protein